MPDTDAALKRVLSFDPLAEAEVLTGRSYKADEATSMIGLALSMENSLKREQMLLARGDTMLTNDLARYLGIIESAGFEQVLVDDFIDDQYDRIATRQYFVYAHRDGLLLAFDTYQLGQRDVSVNGGKVYYNWVPKRDADGRYDYGLTSSGGFRGDVWAGDHDCREALLFKLYNLRRGGEFLPRWQRRPSMYLVNYMEWKTHSNRIDEVIEDRVSRLPDWVREMIGPKGDY